jgi:ferrous iron transport protein A
VRLSDLPKGAAAQVEGVDAQYGDDKIARRLSDLGFVRGEPVRIAATGPFGGEPLLVLIGHTRFALRRSEAARIRVRLATDVAPEPAAKVAAHETAVEGVEP